MSEGKINKKVELRIGSVNEILSERPGWILRWGSTILLAAVTVSMLLASQIEFRNRISVPAVIQLDTSASLLVGKTEIPTFITNEKLSELVVKIKFSHAGKDFTLEETGSKVFLSDSLGVSRNGFVQHIFSLPVPNELFIDNKTDSQIFLTGELLFNVKISLAGRFRNSLNRN